ncbi:TPA: DUF1889 family protein [Escherichia coli]|nr:DUF1889 family protein [Escherichia coli]HAU8817834.1 DUF1889 family protein [Escherichia coli]HCP3184649.1 DUF1889 family protein [Escherichia coli]
MQIKVIYSLIDNMVNFKDKNMPAVIDKALDFIGAMDVSAPTPSSMNKSTAKGIFKYLKELGVPASAADITARADQEGWNPGFTEKMVGWAKKMESGERTVIKNPEYFSTYMQEELKALV